MEDWFCWLPHVPIRLVRLAVSTGEKPQLEGTLLWTCMNFSKVPQTPSKLANLLWRPQTKPLLTSACYSVPTPVTPQLFPLFPHVPDSPLYVSAFTLTLKTFLYNICSYKLWIHACVEHKVALKHTFTLTLSHFHTHRWLSNHHFHTHSKNLVRMIYNFTIYYIQ
jgi:hypothetical protein